MEIINFADEIRVTDIIISSDNSGWGMPFDLSDEGKEAL